MDNDNNTGKRIINISNRLPVKISVKDGAYKYECSEGGLATGLSSVFSEAEHVWIGWPGAEVPVQDQEDVTAALKTRKLKPVFLDALEIEKYYEGFSNGTLWPLFHYFPSYSNYDLSFWESYVSVNQKFADEILKTAHASDIIWIHDYQLMLVPAMIRNMLPDAVIGYFHHIPFPAYEVLRALPWKQELISGLLGADTVGFQTEEDAHYFRQAASTLLSCPQQDKELLADGRRVHVAAFPISIDYQKFRQMATEPETLRSEEKIRRLTSSKLMISVDRLDYSKGILQRLRAFDLFLQRYPEWRKKVTLVHLVVPSRDTVCNYRQLKRKMDRLISEINGRYATLEWQPIHHFYRSFSPHMLSALYKIADVALVTPLRDGMNLVCKEYIASNVSGTGVLVLGEAAGAAKELTEAIQINPNDKGAFCAAICNALNMPEQERSRRMRSMQQKVQANTVSYWMKTFIKTLHRIPAPDHRGICIPLNSTERNRVYDKYLQSTNRLFFLDYDGTMMPFQKHPELVVPDKELEDLLYDIGTQPGNRVVIVSGRDRYAMDRWLGHLPVDLIAEHGAFYKAQKSIWMGIPGVPSHWKSDIRRTLNMFISRIPGSFIEEKSCSMAFHYRAAKAGSADEHLPVLITMLRSQTEHQGLDIMQSDKVIEIKSARVDKGKAVTAMLSRYPSDFVLAAGDDVTDEYMFRALHRSAITIKVGADISSAKYCLKSFEQMRKLLNELIAIPQVGNRIMASG